MECIATSETRLRVASYNIRKCIGLDRRRDPDRILRVIAEVDADVIALQEADRRLGLRPAAIPLRAISESTEMVPVTLDVHEASLGWHGNAVLVRAGMQVTATDLLHLPSFEPRGAVLVELALKGKGRGVRIIAAHLGLTRRHRQHQLKAIIAQIEQRSAMPTIILGDFNEWSPSRGLEPLAADYDVHAPGRSFHAARPVAALDRIATSRDLELMDAGVHERGLALRASDHLPIWADLALGAGTGVLPGGNTPFAPL